MAYQQVPQEFLIKTEMSNTEENIQTESHASISGVGKSLPSDSEMLDWIESIMTPKDDYVEVFFAGLRNGDADATSFQIECNPENFEVTHANSLREVIAKVMKTYPKAR